MSSADIETEQTEATITPNRESILTADTAPEHKINFEAIAQWLKKLNRWVLWEWFHNGKKWTKVPRQANGAGASSVNPETWVDFETVVRLAQAKKCGVGFIFNGDGLVGIDIDDCRNPVTGIIKPSARRIIQELDSYTEVSPSGTGVKIFLLGSLPENFRKKHNRPDGIGVEFFSTGRFFTVDGLHVEGTPTDVEDRHEELNRIYLDVCDWKQPTKQQPATVSTYVPTFHPSGNSDRDTAILALRAISNNPGLDYDDWLEIGMALHSVSNDLLAEWESWSRESDKYVPGECARKWASFTGGKGIGIGTLCHKADQTGSQWRPLSQLKQFNETPEDQLREVIELAYMELGSGKSAQDIAPNLIASIASISGSVSGQTVVHTPESVDPGPFPASLLYVPGFINDVAKYNLSHAARPQPELALAAHLALMSAIVGSKVRTATNLRANVFMLALAGSGAGKDHGRTVNEQILQGSGPNMASIVGCEEIASAPGLYSLMELNGVSLAQLDEIGRFLIASKDPKSNPLQYEIVTAMMKLYSKAGSTFQGKVYSNRGLPTKIYQPHLVLYGTSVRQSFLESLSRDNLDDGFMSRLIVIEATNNLPPINEDAFWESPPEAILEQVREWDKFNTRTNPIVPDAIVMSETPGAKKLFREKSRIFESRYDEKTPGSSIWTRCREKATKLAMLYSCSESREALTITDAAAEWGLNVAEYLAYRMLFLSQEWVSDDKVTSAKQKIIRTIRNAPNSEIDHQGVLRANRWIKGKELREFMSDLIDSGQVGIRDSKTGGKRATVYFLTA